MNRWLTGWRVFTQIVDRLRERIEVDMYPVGSMLPSEAALCAEFGVARNTVRRALAVLEAEGLILTIPSKGRLVVGGDKAKDEPYLYQAIAHELRGQIERRELEPGAALPSESCLRRRHGVSRSTVRQALDVLEQEGLIVSEHGRGRYVRR
ncbi:GntR family transcriptional regulator [Actinomadura sp. ATCC 31491]|uniref:GntR family transcriptional regulator n=1 Tax=Actinomadura luzonensis TaxID=2805427 RepID=A0ABT0FLY8_9ACTN|nr:GntR family transcriptional regulator [Actinomadura luzonensis]MCK2213342.1 GntR family transcriptional regulator [Actinomadura luzonensis]